MATSGTYTFAMTRDEVIASALRALGAFGVDDPIPPNDLTNCAQALNIICQTWIMKGLPLWCVEDLRVPMVVGQATYDLNTLTPGNYRPGRILDAEIEDPTGNQVTVQVTSRYDYNTLGDKTQPGIPNQLFYDPQRDNGLMTVYNVPNLPGYVMVLTVQRPLQDVNLAVQNVDIPREALQAMKWNLMDELASEYGTPQLNLQMVAGKAKQFLDELMGWEQETASVYFTPARRVM
jgi:hypothetical protein